MESGKKVWWLQMIQCALMLLNHKETDFGRDSPALLGLLQSKEPEACRVIIFKGSRLNFD